MDYRKDRLPCPSLPPGVCSSSCLLIQWCHLMPSNPLILCCPFLLLPSMFTSIRVFSNELAVCIRWPKYQSFSFSISPSNEYSGFIFCRIDWFWSPCSPRDFQESSPTPQFKNINSPALSFLYGPTLTSIHDSWKKTIALTRWTFVNKVMSLFFNSAVFMGSQWIGCD